MTSRGTNRPASEAALGNRARQALSRTVRAAAAESEARENRIAAEKELTDLHRAACEKFGRPIPENALLLDILELIEIRPGDIWHWTGMRNNKELPVLRVDRAEKSLIRFLAIAFGVINEDEWGMLYPTETGTDDCNPWHRTLRDSPRPVGNRWEFRLPKDEPKVNVGDG